MSLRTIEYATNTYKKYFYTFRINKITFTNSERRKELLNFYGMFGKNLPISAAFIAILKMELPQCNAIGVRTPPDSQMSGKCISDNQPFYFCEVLEFFNLNFQIIILSKDSGSPKIFSLDFIEVSTLPESLQRMVLPYLLKGCIGTISSPHDHNSRHILHQN